MSMNNNFFFLIGSNTCMSMSCNRRYRWRRHVLRLYWLKHRLLEALTDVDLVSMMLIDVNSVHGPFYHYYYHLFVCSFSNDFFFEKKCG